MPLMYVHGVGNRADKRYDLAEGARDSMFRRLLCPAVFGDPDKVVILSPYWGQHGADPVWGFATLPSAEAESLGAPDDLVELLPYGFVRTPNRTDTVLVEVAHSSIADAVDLLCTMMADGTLTSVADFVAAVVGYCEEKEAARPWGSERGRFPWLADVHDDGAFVDRLCAEVAAWSATESPGSESFGGAGSVRDTMAAQVGRLHRSVAAWLTRPVADGARRLFGARLSMFIGDVLVYLAQRGTPGRPGPIPSVVAEALESAASTRASADPLVVVAHSMGGNIVYDVLSHYRKDLEVDVLVTVGSQVGLFEEFKLFGASVGIHQDGRVPVARPPNVGHWINVVDRSDILAYRTNPAFVGVDDYNYPSGAGWAHTAYLRQPFFYRRLAARIQEASR